MKTLLINASVTGKSLSAAKAKLDKENIEYDVMNISSLIKEALTKDNIQAFFSDSKDIVEELNKYDKVVIATSMNNFTYNSMFKSFVDKLTLSGLTFKYTLEGPVPLNAFDFKAEMIFTSGTPKNFLPEIAQQTELLISTNLAFIGIKLDSFTWISGTDVEENSKKLGNELLELV